MWADHAKPKEIVWPAFFSIALALLPGCYRGAKTMTHHPPDADSPAIVRFESGPRLIGPEELAQLRSTVSRFLDTQWQQVSEVVPTDLLPSVPRHAGEPSVGGSGEIRFGQWILEASGNQLRVSHRPVPPGSYRFLLYLEEVQPRQWRVARPAFERILPRR